MAHFEPPHQDLHCLQIRLLSSPVVKELICTLSGEATSPYSVLAALIKLEQTVLGIKLNVVVTLVSHSLFVTKFVD